MVALVVIVIVVGVALSIWQDIRNRTCPNCGQRMERSVAFWSGKGEMTCGCGYVREFVRRSRGIGDDRRYYDDVVSETYPQPPRPVLRRRRPARPPALPAPADATTHPSALPAPSGSTRPLPPGTETTFTGTDHGPDDDQPVSGEGPAPTG